jgi:hypothetical protein
VGDEGRLDSENNEPVRMLSSEIRGQKEEEKEEEEGSREGGVQEEAGRVEEEWGEPMKLMDKEEDEMTLMFRPRVWPFALYPPTVLEASGLLDHGRAWDWECEYRGGLKDQ